MTAFYNDFERYACDVIETNIKRGRIPDGTVCCRPIEELDPTEFVGYSQYHLFAGIGGGAYACRLAGVPDDFSVGTMGFPCPGFSVAGTGDAFEDPRSKLFFNGCAFFEVVRPRWLLFENVPALRTAGAKRDPDGIGAIEIVLATLETIGYTPLPPIVVGSDDVGAPQKRKRVWIVARANETLVNPDSAGCPERCGAQPVSQELAAAECSSRWPARPREPQHEWEEPRVTTLEAEIKCALGVSADGLPERLVRSAQREVSRARRDALKGLGNAWVPQCAVPILKWILEQEALR